MASIKFAYAGKSPAHYAGEIQQLLSQHGARKVTLEYNEDGHPQAVTFQMVVHGEPLWFRVAPNPEGMLQALKEADDIKKAQENKEQARKTAWANKLGWLESQFAQIQANQAEIEQLLLGMGVADNGETVYDLLRREKRLLTQ